MMVKNQKKLKSIEQSEKSKSGTEFNKYVSVTLSDISKKLKNFYYVKAEPKYKTKRCGDYVSTSKCNLDHFSFFVSDIHKQVLLIFSDNTKTWRDRIYGKANNGTKIQKMQREIASQFFNDFPQYLGYEIIYNCIVIFPDFVMGAYENSQLEEKYINDGCVGINYGTGNLSSDDTCWLLDGGFRLAQFLKCLELVDKSVVAGNKLNREIMVDTWKSVYSDYKYKPARWLAKDIILLDIEHTKYSLIHKNNEYSVDDVVNALDEFCIKHKKNISKEAAIQLLLDFLNKENQNP